MHEYVILVDAADTPIGQAEKLEAHQEGLLHRAFSVLVFNVRGKLLLQQRAASKYHAANLWANTCCGHPRPGEEVVTAAARRLREELGLSCALSVVGRVTYKLALPEGLIEHEVDYVLVGITDAVPTPNPTEVQAVRYATMAEVLRELKAQPQKFAPWFPIAIKKLVLETGQSSEGREK